MKGSICFCWSGFPQYAARCVGAFVRDFGGRVVVVATRPRVPVEGMEALCGCDVRWIDAGEEGSVENLVGFMPDAVLATGWHIAPFNRFCAEVRKAGGRAICLCDNNRTGTCKEFLKGLRFRLMLNRKFDAFMVPGRSGRRLLEGYGVSPDRISEGMYSADESLFHDGLPLEEREKRIMYVGQFSDRKNVARMCEAFRSIEKREGWELHMYGCGSVEIESGDGVVVHPFVQPEALAEEYRKARIFCLASLEEHWGLVVHEAALSGCALCLSDRVGAAEDLLDETNGRAFDPYDAGDIALRLHEIMQWDGSVLRQAHGCSLELASGIGLGKFVRGVKGVI